MNFTVDVSIIFNAMFAVVAVLIKMELHDIKSRITRLENVFINQNGKDQP